MGKFLTILLLSCCFLPVPRGQALPFFAKANSAESAAVSEGIALPESADSAVDSGPAAPGRLALNLERLQVLELSDQDGLDWRRDWWKYLTMALVGAICLLLVVHITNLILRIVGVFICVGSGVLGAIFVSPMLTGWLPQMMPAELSARVSPDVICLFLGALCGYALAATILAILRKPAQRKKKNA